MWGLAFQSDHAEQDVALLKPLIFPNSWARQDLEGFARWACLVKSCHTPEHSVMVLLSPGARAGVPGIRNPDFRFLSTRMRGAGMQPDPNAEGEGEHRWEELEQEMGFSIPAI